MGGDIGVDEGGILQALSTPIIHREIVYERKLKKGTKTETTTLEITGAHIVALLLGKAFLTLFLLKIGLAGDALDKAKEILTGIGETAVGTYEGTRDWASDPTAPIGEAITTAKWAEEGYKRGYVFDAIERARAQMEAQNNE